MKNGLKKQRADGKPDAEFTNGLATVQCSIYTMYTRVCSYTQLLETWQHTHNSSMHYACVVQIQARDLPVYTGTLVNGELVIKLLYILPVFMTAERALQRYYNGNAWDENRPVRHYLPV